MSPPLFGDLGKEARDLFEKNFNLDQIKLHVKGLMYGPVQFQSTQKCRIMDGNVSSEVVCKYEAEDITLTSKLNTESSLLNCELKAKLPELMGINVTAVGHFNPTNAANGISLSANYRAADYNMELVASSSSLRANGVYSIPAWQKAWTLGVSSIVDISGKMHANLIASCQNNQPDTCFFNYDIQNKTLSGSLHHVISPNIQLGAIYTFGDQSRMAYCGSFTIKERAIIKARITSKLGLSFTYQLKSGISATICTEVDVQKLKQGNHKFGLGLEFS